MFVVVPCFVAKSILVDSYDILVHILQDYHHSVNAVTLKDVGRFDRQQITRNTRKCGWCFSEELWYQWIVVDKCSISLLDKCIKKNQNNLKHLHINTIMHLDSAQILDVNISGQKGHYAQTNFLHWKLWNWQPLTCNLMAFTTVVAKL